MKHLTVFALALALSATACKKDKEEAPEEPAAPATAPANTPPPKAAEPATPPAPTGPAIPEVSMTGPPSADLINVFRAGVEGIDDAEPAEAAAILQGLLTKYNVADLRAKSKAAKDAGKGASDAQKQEYDALKERYEERAAELGEEDPAAFSGAAEAWGKAFGLN